MSQKAQKQRGGSQSATAHSIARQIANAALVAAFGDPEFPILERAAGPRSAMDQAIAETLEGRTLMSTVTLTDGVLAVDAAGDDRLTTKITYNKDADKIHVITSGSEVRKQSFPRLSVQAISITGSNGPDRIKLDRQVDVPAHILAGDGNDVVIGGRGNDVIDGGAGKDRIVARSGDDIVAGAVGNDRVSGGPGNDLVRGGDGKDKLSAGAGDDTVEGGAGNDRMSGGRGKNTFAGGEGRDRMVAARGENTLVDASSEDRGVRVEPAKAGSEGPTKGNKNPWTPMPGNPAPVTPAPVTPAPTPAAPTPAPAKPTPVPAPVKPTPAAPKPTTPAPAPAPTPTPTPTMPSGANSADWGGAFNPSLGKNAAPKAVLRFVANTQSGPAGHTVNVNATSTQFFNGDAIGARFEWDFGDTGSKYNKLVGWTAAHTYDKAGAYTVKLTVTDISGKATTVASTVNITADSRRSIFVDAKSGSDSNNGSSEGSAVRTLARASKLAGDNTRILLKRGQVHEVSDSIRIDNKNVIVDAYGAGKDAPTVKKVAGMGSSVFYIAPTGIGFIAQNLSLDSIWDFSSAYGKKKVPAEGFTVTADNFTVRNCAFHNINTGIQTEAGPNGVLVQNCYFSHGIRSYGIWAQGYDHAYLGNKMVNSQQEHLIRADGTDGKGVIRVLIHDNDLSRTVANGKGSIELRTASWFYVSGNRINGGTLRAGLQDIDQKQFPKWASYKTEYGVIENNITHKVFVNLRPGTDHVAVRNNVINVDDFFAINVENIEKGYDHVRKTDDVRIERNTVISMGSTGYFLRMHGKATNVVVKNNLYVAPNLKLDGTGRTAAVGVSGVNDLSGFTEISGNVWPDIQGNWRQNGLNYLGSSTVDRNGYRDTKAWEALPQVKNDAYRNIALSSGYKASVGGITAGSSLAKAA